MTQAQNTRTANLVSVSRNDGTDGPRTASEGSARDVLQSSALFADFVFEEAGQPLNVAALEPAYEPLKPTTEHRVEALLPREVANGVGRKVVALPTQSSQLPKASRNVLSTPAATTSVTSNGAEKETRKSTVDGVVPSAEAESLVSRAVAASRNGDLDLRAKFNQKEAELLRLRSELSARDRLALELNERLLEIERSRFKLSEELEESKKLVEEGKSKILAYAADLEASAKRMAEMKVVFRRAEENLKRKNDADCDALKAELCAKLGDEAAAYATKVEQLERAHAAEVASLNAARTAAEDEARDKHFKALKMMEASHTQALSNMEATHAKKTRALQEVHEKTLAKATSSHAAALEAALAAAASEKASALADLEGTQRATQSELTAASNNVQLLEREQASQSARIVRHETTIATLEEALDRTTAKAQAAEDTLASLRRAFAVGLSLLNGQPSPGPEGGR